MLLSVDFVTGTLVTKGVTKRDCLLWVLLKVRPREIVLLRVLPTVLLELFDT